jgi:HSP20 family protein
LPTATSGRPAAEELKEGANVMTLITKTNGQETKLPVPSDMFETFFSPELVRWPFPELTSFRRTMNSLLDNVMIPETSALAPAMDVYEKEGTYIVETAIPGFKKDDIHIEISDNRLTVYGKATVEKTEETKGRYFYRELRRGTFSRTVAFPAEIDAERVEAVYEHGVLKIALPPIKPAPTKKVAIKG